jgi:hypothetical protein
MDRETLLVLLAREAGFLKTVGACRRLDMTATQLLALRRQALEAALGMASLPALAVKTMPLPMVEIGDA